MPLALRLPLVATTSGVRLGTGTKLRHWLAAAARPDCPATRVQCKTSLPLGRRLLCGLGLPGAPQPDAAPSAPPRPVAAMAAAASSSSPPASAFGHPLGLEVVEIHNPDELNFILGHAHFIKTVEDLYEVLTSAAGSLRFGIAFCEASEGHGDMAGRRVRFDGNDDKLVEVAKRNALALGAGHTFIVFLEGGFPVSVLNAVKAVPEVCRVHCATANPTAVVLGTLGTDRKGILGVIDGFISTAYETEKDKKDRHDFLRMIGYKR